MEREEEFRKFEEQRKKNEEEYKLKKKKEKEKSINEYNARRKEINDFLKQNKYNFYDIIIEINSLLDLKKNGCEIIFPSNNFNNEYLNEYVTTVGVIGNKKKGKSFLLNKLFSIDFPHGFEIDTEGISFKYLINERIKFGIIDTVGMEQSITNNFIKDFVLSKSKIIIVVVELLTDSEQMELLNNIKYSLKGNEKIIVIHNLFNFVKVNQVKNYINNILKKILKLKEINIVEIYENENDIYNKICFIENLSDSKKNISIKHLILANDSLESESGDYYNYCTINFLRNYLRCEGEPIKFDLISELRDFIYNNAYKYFKKKNINESEEAIYPINYDEIQVLDEENSNNKKKIKIPSNLELKLKNYKIKEKFSENIFIPKYCYYKKIIKKRFFNKNKEKNEDVEVLVIEFELNGKIKEMKQKITIDIYNNYYCFLITGIKESNDNNNIIIDNKNNENNFKLEFKINMNELELKNNKLLKSVKKNDIIKLYYEINNFKNLDNKEEIKIESHLKKEKKNRKK